MWKNSIIFGIVPSQENPNYRHGSDVAGEAIFHCPVVAGWESSISGHVFESSRYNTNQCSESIPPTVSNDDK